MPQADPSYLDSLGTSIVAARFDLRPVLDADPSYLGIVGTSIVAACPVLTLCLVLDADSSCFGGGGTSFVVVQCVASS